MIAGGFDGQIDVGSLTLDDVWEPHTHILISYTNTTYFIIRIENVAPN